MAGQVGKLILETGIKGFEEVQELGKGLKQIAKLADRTDKEFLKAAKSVKDFANSNRNSVTAIRGQIVALDKLKQSATIGGKAYKSLSKDIISLNTQLLTLSNVEKAAQSSASAAAMLPERDARGRLVGDKRIGGTRSLATLANVGRTFREDKFTAQIAEMNTVMRDQSITSKEYASVLKNLLNNTREYNAALANQTARQGSINASERVRAAGRSRFSISTSSQGYNPFTTFAGFDGSDLSKAGRPFVEGLPVQGPFQRGPKRTAFMQQNAVPQFLQSFFETKSFKEALKEPLIPPMGFGPGGSSGGGYSGKGPQPLFSPEFAKSSRGFSARIAEMSDVLDDLEIGSKEYITVARALKKVQDEQASAFKKTEEAMAGKSRTTGPRGSRAARGLSLGADGTFVGQPGPTAKDFGPFKAPEVKKVSQSVKELTDEILKNTAAGNGSINTLTKQRAKLEEIRNGLDPTSRAFARTTKEIAKTDKALAKLNSNKFSGQNLRRTGQSILGAGFVGGPAGFLGAGIGAGVEALRPGGDMAGGAITGGLVASQVLTPVSQAIGGATTYASDIEKANIALRGVTKSTENYEAAQAAITKAVEVYNVPQEIATRGMTRLSAAVLGAGGNIHNATEAFLNTTVAIKGTAGSADDVKSAITAMVQIFSKGKVSAEELSGQLGERFPAAVTKFAKANNISTQELQKNLKDGTVGLDMLSKFITSLGEEYAPLAKRIAESNEEAGARSRIAMNKMKIAVGNALKPIGADFQIIGAQLLTDLIPALESLALIGASVLKPLAAVVGFLSKQFDLLAGAVSLAAGALVGLAVQKVVIAFGALSTAVKAATVSFAAFNKVMIANKFVAAGTALAGLIFLVSRFGRTYTQVAEDIKKTLMGQSIEQTKKELLELEQKLKNIQPIIDANKDKRGGVPKFVQKEFDDLTNKKKAYEEFIAVEKKAAEKAKFDALKAAKQAKSPFAQFTKELEEFDVALEQIGVNGFKKLEDTIMQFVTTGKLAFKDLVTSVLHELTRLAIQQTVTKPLFGLLKTALGIGIEAAVPTNFTKGIGPTLDGAAYSDYLSSRVTSSNWGGGRTRMTSGSLPIGVNAMGNAFGKNGIVPYYKGGVVSKPTMFKYGGSNLGVMGEAGPEAILPLQRGRGGRLGVAMQGGSGGGTTNVNYTGPTLNFNGDEYVPKSAVGEIISAAAARGESKTISSLKNSRGRRASLGL